MAQKGGRPKGSTRCHPGAVEVRLHPTVHGTPGVPPTQVSYSTGSYRDMADWRSAATSQVERAIDILDAILSHDHHTAHTLSQSDETPMFSDSRIQLAIDGGTPALRIHTALHALKESFATANLSADGTFTLRAATAPGADGTPSAQELMTALSLLPDSSYLLAPAGADMFAAMAPSAKDYAAAVLDIPNIRQEAIDLPSRLIGEHERRSRGLLDDFRAGRIDLDTLCRRDRDSCDAARRAANETISNLRQRMARIPESSTQYADLAQTIAAQEARLQDGLYALSPDGTAAGLAKAHAEAMSYYDSEIEGEDDGSGALSESSPGESYTRSVYAALEKVGLTGGESDRCDRSELGLVTSRAYHLESEAQEKSANSGYSDHVGGYSTLPQHLLPLIDGYVTHLQPPGLKGNEESSRRMAKALLEAVTSINDSALRQQAGGRGQLNGWDGSLETLPRAEHHEALRLRGDETHALLPYVHDFGGPYQGVSPTPVIIALAPYLTGTEALALSGQLNLQPGWEDKAVRDLVSTYRVTRKAAEDHVREASGNLRPVSVAEDEEMRVIYDNNATNPGGYRGKHNPERVGVRLKDGSVIETVRSVTLGSYITSDPIDSEIRIYRYGQLLATDPDSTDALSAVRRYLEGAAKT
jgi:hypothetical protein